MGYISRYVEVVTNFTAPPSPPEKFKEKWVLIFEKFRNSTGINIIVQRIEIFKKVLGDHTPLKA